ncbi:MAG: heavy metal-responsive transcriptional regulator [Gammaproteobacteria bacterium]|nr:heavy metal-responsive transcriptional regulator [Gammaproteobacteria bacterium]
MKSHRIGDVARLTGLTPDTLRYYERIGLLPRVGRRNYARDYTDSDISRLRFIRRAQKMNFKLVEIGELLKMRAAPHKARANVRGLTANKLAEVEAQLKELQALRNELRLMLNLCGAGKAACPIIRRIENT